MDRLFIHNIARQDANRDFRKSVSGRVSIEVVERVVATESKEGARLMKRLRAQFPAGMFNCWGIPRQAGDGARELAFGDLVLLAQTSGVEGHVRALARVKVARREALPRLSEAIWGHDGFPDVFFFETQHIHVPWREFLASMGYAPEEIPAGTFCSVDAERSQMWEDFDLREYEASFAQACPAEVPTSALDIAEVELERTACLGSCPVYTVTLRRDGSAQYSGEQFAPRRGTFSGTIDIESFDRIAKLIIDSRFFAFRGNYWAFATDLPSAITRVGLEGDVVQVRDEDMSSAPPALRAIEKAIDSAAEGIVWRSGAPPLERAHLPVWPDREWWRRA